MISTRLFHGSGRTDYFSVLIVLSMLLTIGNAAAAAQESARLGTKDQNYTLTNLDDESVSARILHADSRAVFVRIGKNGNYKIPLEQLTADSVKLVGMWKKEFAEPLSSEQRRYLREFKTTPATKKKPHQDASQPVLIDPDPSKTWVRNPDFSDEFNSTKLSDKKWFWKMATWGDRSWSSDNVFLKDGSLVVRARYEPHQGRDGTNYFYKLGICQSKQKTTYGYFEARIKGCSKFPGLCPAFWLYSNGKELNPDYPHVTYSEIDIVELEQGLWEPDLKREVDAKHIDLNLHCRIMKDGKEIWQRPNSLPEVCKHYWRAPWDPADDYHVYAVENTPEKITWIIDGKKVAEEKNLYWHLPMNVTFTMELRPPLIAWGGPTGRMPVPENSTDEGFPTEMKVDWVRSWTLAE